MAVRRKRKDLQDLDIEFNEILLSGYKIDAKHLVFECRKQGMLAIDDFKKYYIIAVFLFILLMSESLLFLFCLNI